MAGAAEEADAAVAVVQCVLAGAAPCEAAADSRIRWALGPRPDPRHDQVPAGLGRVLADGQVREHVREAAKSLARDPEPAHRGRAADPRAVHDREAAQSLGLDRALQVRVRGPAALAVESAKAALGQAVVCQEWARERGREQGDLVAISPAVVPQPDNSAISSTCRVPRLVQLERAARDGPVALPPTSCNKGALLSGRLSARLWVARRLALASRHNSPLAVRIGQAEALAKSGMAKLVQAIDRQIQSRALAALVRTLAAPERPISAGLAHQILADQALRI